MGYFNKNDNIFKFKEVEKSRFNFDLMTSNTEEQKIEQDSINDFDEINTLIMKEIKSKI
jgi:Holliday junction resolvase